MFLLLNKQIQIGVIGLGAVGERLLKSFEDRVDIKVAALCDTSVARLKEMSQEYAVSQVFNNYQDLLALKDLDAVYIAVPPKYHEDIALAAIQANKHILCEKPLANSVAEAKKMVDAISNSGLISAMHFPLNYQASLLQFEKLKDEFVGKTRRIQLVMHFPHWPRLWQKSDWVESREQGGFVLEVGVHWIQAIQRIFGEITHVRSVLQFPEDPALCENSIIAEMKLADGTIVFIDGISNIGGDEHLEFAVYGTEGTLKLLNWRQLLVGKNGEALEEVVDFELQPKNLITEFVHALHGEEAEVIDFEVGYRAQVVLEALRHPISSDWQELIY